MIYFNRYYNLRRVIMDVKKLERRNSTLDLIRIVAVFSVLSVHFFLHNGFYSEKVEGFGPIEGIFQFV